MQSALHPDRAMRRKRRGRTSRRTGRDEKKQTGDFSQVPTTLKEREERKQARELSKQQLVIIVDTKRDGGASRKGKGRYPGS